MIAIAPTDLDWFNFLRMRLDIKVINFWTSTPWNIRKLEEGDKFSLMLKSPIRKKDEEVGGVGPFHLFLIILKESIECEVIKRLS
ncbi:hypothetical protein MWH25_02380 [Natroniella acetigena]|uniref:hypothetical protein n=1 Tax=Natroniella acetigena TaxID=52004 RepID=UPI00200AD91C|nr:hypothetical protein [Natroniella acetigena]MCK8826596.1 hypothetical protein [Natroniella acetigena]